MATTTQAEVEDIPRHKGMARIRTTEEVRLDTEAAITSLDMEVERPQWDTIKERLVMAEPGMVELRLVLMVVLLVDMAHLVMALKAAMEPPVVMELLAMEPLVDMEAMVVEILQDLWLFLSLSIKTAME